jgi:hypothetical protein
MAGTLVKRRYSASTASQATIPPRPAKALDRLAVTACTQGWSLQGRHEPLAMRAVGAERVRLIDDDEAAHLGGGPGQRRQRAQRAVGAIDRLRDDEARTALTDPVTQVLHVVVAERDRIGAALRMPSRNDAWAIMSRYTGTPGLATLWSRPVFAAKPDWHSITAG